MIRHRRQRSTPPRPRGPRLTFERCEDRIALSAAQAIYLSAETDANEEGGFLLLDSPEWQELDSDTFVTEKVTSSAEILFGQDQLGAVLESLGGVVGDRAEAAVILNEGRWFDAFERDGTASRKFVGAVEALATRFRAQDAALESKLLNWVDRLPNTLRGIEEGECQFGANTDVVEGASNELDTPTGPFDGAAGFDPVLAAVELSGEKLGAVADADPLPAETLAMPLPRESIELALAFQTAAHNPPPVGAIDLSNAQPEGGAVELSLAVAETQRAMEAGFDATLVVRHGPDAAEFVARAELNGELARSLVFEEYGAAAAIPAIDRPPADEPTAPSPKDLSEGGIGEGRHRIEEEREQAFARWPLVFSLSTGALAADRWRRTRRRATISPRVTAPPGASKRR